MKGKTAAAVLIAVMMLGCTGCSKDKTDNSLYGGGLRVPKISSSVIWETDNVRVTAEYFKRIEAGVKIKIENTSSSELTLHAADLYVNDYAMSSTLWTDVPAKSTLYDTIGFSTSTLELNDIQDLYTMEFCLEADYSDDRERERSGAIKLGVTSDDWKKEQTAPEGQILYDEGDIKIISCGISKTAFSGDVLCVYVENNSGRDINVRDDRIDINGEKSTMKNYFTLAKVGAGRKAFGTVDLSKLMTYNEQTKLKSLKISFEIEFPKGKVKTALVSIDDISGYSGNEPKSTEAEKEG